MRVDNSALLLAASLGCLVNPALGAPRIGIADRNSPRQIVAINATLPVPGNKDQTIDTSTTWTTSSLSKVASPPSVPPQINPKPPSGTQSQTASSSSSTSTSTSSPSTSSSSQIVPPPPPVGAPTDGYPSGPRTAGPPRPLSSSSSSYSTSSSLYISSVSSTSQSSSDSDTTISATNHPSSNSTWSLQFGTSKTIKHKESQSVSRTHPPPSSPPTVTVDCPIDGASCITPTATNNGTRTTISTTCTPLQEGQPFTVFSVVYPSTVTLYGNRSDYGVMNQLPETPRYCPTILPGVSTSKEATSVFYGSASQTYSFGGGGGGDGDSAEPTSTKVPHNAKDSSTPFPMVPSPYPSSSQVTVTQVTTVKTPYTAFPNDPPQKYSQTWVDPWPDPEVHHTAPAGGGGYHPEPYNRPKPTYRITAGPDHVVINGQTYSNLGVGQTTVVSVDGGHFTILPTAVIGEGGTVTKPAPLATAAAAPTPTAGSVGGLPVTVSGSNAIVGGITMQVPTDGLTTVIQGQTVIMNPTEVAVGPDVFTFNHGQLPRQTDIIVVGGEPLTVIGKSILVIHSTTITYGPSLPGTTEVIDDDTVTIAPSGVVLHSMTIGGPPANITATRYEIVGGATITRIAPSLAVINGKTFTVGPGTHWTTTVIGGETIKIGPTGVVIASVTLTYPFGDSNSGTIVPSGTWLNTFPMETNTTDSDEEDSKGSVLLPSLLSTWTAFCIAIGVWIFA